MQRALLALAVSLSLATALLAAGGSSKAETSSSNPRARAVEAYNQGLALRDRAWASVEKRAAATSGEQRARLQQQIDGAFQQAAERFQAAVELDSSLHEAHSSLGYAQRRLGRHEAALASYDRALALNPDYAEAIEYRGQAYLGLDRHADAQRAFDRLVELGETGKAATLLGALTDWAVARRSEPPEGFDAEALAAVAQWISQRRAALGEAGHDEAGW